MSSLDFGRGSPGVLYPPKDGALRDCDLDREREVDGALRDRDLDRERESDVLEDDMALLLSRLLRVFLTLVVLILVLLSLVDRISS